MALQGANTYLCWLLGQVCVYLGLRDIEAELDNWFTKMRTRQSARNKPLPAGKRQCDRPQINVLAVVDTLEVTSHGVILEQSRR